MSQEKTTVLFDGICVLCNRSVHFLIKRDRHRALEFASLQSEGLPAGQGDSMLVRHKGVTYAKSDAVLQILRRLPAPWPFFAFLGRLIPRPLRNFLYDLLARNRYRWFGKLT